MKHEIKIYENIMIKCLIFFECPVYLFIYLFLREREIAVFKIKKISYRLIFLK